MSEKIFINYRRDDVPGDARGIRDGLIAKFGKPAIFMDIDNLLAGQRFDKELEKALAHCDVLVAVIGPRWIELLSDKEKSGERDFVREEIAAALAKGITVVPVRAGHEGRMPPLPRKKDLPADIADLVLHQKHDVAHEHFSRDIAELATTIAIVRKGSPQPPRWGRIATAAGVVAIVVAGLAMQFPRMQPPWLVRNSDEPSGAHVTASLSASTANVARPDTSHSRSPDEPKLALRSDVEPEHQQGKTAGTTFRDCAACPVMVVLPTGEFKMGAPESEAERNKDEPLPRSVSIRHALAVGKFEVSFDEWHACVTDGDCSAEPNDEGWGRGKRPVINVSWNDVTGEYLKWLSKVSGQSYRLLSEAEWEYAARAGTLTRYEFGDAIANHQAQFSENSAGSARQTIDTGSFKPNAWGLYDMHGNVWEWVEDCWNKSNPVPPADGTAQVQGDCRMRVLRGGSWGTLPPSLRSAARSWSASIDHGNGVGFRVARTLAPSTTPTSSDANTKLRRAPD